MDDLIKGDALDNGEYHIWDGNSGDLICFLGAFTIYENNLNKDKGEYCNSFTNLHTDSPRFENIAKAQGEDPKTYLAGETSYLFYYKEVEVFQIR